ncbi:flavin-containing monooxygenase [Mycolicibacterium gilvum]|uniref:flavin-containing monooxygenase n=1 Tax=Mycolicibacterium gilvum TaxID=1804 RepID=UPI0040462DFC
MTEEVDIVVVGAGISGISAAWHLQNRCPGKSFVILEGRDDLGGTWDLFRYPGIRSDSDMFTLGFRFKPWTSEKAIADGPSIMAYLRETVAEFGIDRHIRYGHRMVAADWSDADNRWTVHVERGGERVEISARYLMACSGYYDYDRGYCPEFAGAQDFEGPIIHPQHWPEDLDYTGKRVVVIGSGATAVTLVPALADSGAGHVTMLQRSPTYVGALPDVDPFTVRTNKTLPTGAAYVVNRWKSILFQSVQYQLSRRFPRFMRRTLMTMAQRRLPEGYDVARHFGPSYNPWDQRLCLAPNGDLFETIRTGRADVVTDTIERFDRTGITLSSGQHLDADIIVTATGLNLRLFGGAVISRNGEVIELSETMAYKGMLLTGMPNLAFTIGYTNASWTLKADLVSEFFCRIINYMDEHSYTRMEPRHPGGGVDERPLLDFTPGYVLRALDHLPKAGSRAPWRLKQNYLFDLQLIRRGRVDDEALEFGQSAVTTTIPSSSL